MAPDRREGLPEVAKKVHPMINRNVSDGDKRSIDQQTKPVAANLGGEGGSVPGTPRSGASARSWSSSDSGAWKAPATGLIPARKVPSLPNFKTHDSGDFLISVFETTDKNNYDWWSTQRPWLYDLLESRDDF